MSPIMFEVTVRGELFGVYANLQISDGLCQRCRKEVPLLKFVDIDQVIDLDTTIPLCLASDHKLVESLKQAVISESMFRPYCTDHLPD